MKEPHKKPRAMSEKPRIVTARLCRRGEEEKEFDREFWRSVGPEGRFRAAWEMVLDYLRFRGEDATDVRIARTVTALKRRGS